MGYGTSKVSQGECCGCCRLHSPPIEPLRVLILGNRNSEKSALAQRFLHLYGFSNEELDARTAFVRRLMLWSIEEIVMEMKQMGIEYEDKEREADQEVLFTARVNYQNDLPEEMMLALKRLWNDDGVQTCVCRLDDSHDSKLYTLNNMERILSSDFQPTERDVLHCADFKVGTVEAHTKYKGVDINIFEVAGARSDRRHWIRSMSGISAVVFCVALSEYAHLLKEDLSINSMQETSDVLRTICTNPYFGSAPVILVFTKKERFKRKLEEVNLAVCFGDYDRKTYEEALEFVTQKFENVINDTGGKGSSFFSCPTDPDDSGVEAILDWIVDNANERK